MRPLALVAMLLLAPSLAAAQGRPDSRTVSCGRLAAAVRTQGALVIGTGPYVYERYVTGGQFCSRGDVTEPAWIEAADTPQCFVGYACRPRFPVSNR